MIFSIHTPNIVLFNNSFESYIIAEKHARELLDKSHIKFITIKQDDILLTTIFKKGYDIYAWWKLKKLLNDNLVKDFFIIEKEGIKNYYAILKQKKP
jgi:hypothetical protein